VKARTTAHAPRNHFARRLERLAVKTHRAKLDALIVYTPVNRFYLTGFDSTNGLLVVEPGETPVFLTDFRYIETARAQVDMARTALLTDVPAQMGGLARRRKWRRVGFEGSASFERYESYRRAMPEVCEWVEAEGLIRELRVRKDATEQAALRRVARLGDEVLRRTIEHAAPGMREWDLRRVLRGYVDELDAAGESFPCIISAGSNSSKPHAKVTDRLLRRGQPLLFDMGVVCDHYCSDMTRTYFLSRPSDKMREIYEIVLSAQRRALDVVRAGRTCEEVDAAARRYIEKKGYGKYFGHGLGHGVGLEIHEAPNLKPGSKDVLKPGMVVSIEPGIYLPGIGGVRIEDVVIVRRDGCENLTGMEKELTTL